MYTFRGKSNDSIYHFVISGGYEYAYGQEPVLYRLEIGLNNKIINLYFIFNL